MFQDRLTGKMKLMNVVMMTTMTLMMINIQAVNTVGTHTPLETTLHPVVWCKKVMMMILTVPVFQDKCFPLFI